LHPDPESFRRLQLNFDAQHFSHGLFLARAFEEGHVHYRADEWRTSAENFDTLTDGALASARTDRSGAVVVAIGEALCWVMLKDGYLNVQIASKRVGALSAALASLRERFPRLDPVVDVSVVDFKFVCRNEVGSHTVQGRQLEVPAWADVAVNYPGRTRDSLTGLMNGFRCDELGGKTILWHGGPGTGKTYARFAPSPALGGTGAISRS
jgi:hypothetical protein